MSNSLFSCEKRCFVNSPCLKPVQAADRSRAGSQGDLLFQQLLHFSVAKLLSKRAAVSLFFYKAPEYHAPLYSNPLYGALIELQGRFSVNHHNDSQLFLTIETQWFVEVRQIADPHKIIFHFFDATLDNFAFSGFEITKQQRPAFTFNIDDFTCSHLLIPGGLFRLKRSAPPVSAFTPCIY
ncbi:MAG: hypothetical protein FWG74_00145 [Planctomycetes bacterium]|nr:hypothetical protein [Planctomycetota bacterium]